MGITGFYLSVADPDRVIHEPARLKIMSVQLSRLEEAGYIAIEKTFVGKTPRTTARMTPEGREAFTAYRAYLERLLDATGLGPGRSYA